MFKFSLSLKKTYLVVTCVMSLGCRMRQVVKV